MNKINELVAGSKKVNIKGKITEIGEEKTFDTGKVCTATIEDDTGTISLSLWNEQVDQVSLDDNVVITNGYVTEFRDELQLQSGKYGNMEIVE